MVKTIYFVAGEASADNHGGALMRSLQELVPNDAIQFLGRGGPQMRAIAGPQLKDWIGQAAVLGLWEVIRKYGYFREQFHETLREIQESNPDAVLLIDYPGFNLRLAHALRKQSRRGKIIYYISPQVWAWNPSRIKKMARVLDLVLCIFPFEAELYNQAGLRAMFVGHPMIERLDGQKSEAERDSNSVGLFPGSRLREVRKIFPVLLKVANLLLRRKPDLHFEVAATSSELATEMHHMMNSESQQQGAIEIKVGETAAIMQRTFVGIVASGSATLEAAYFRLPFVLIYKVAWPTYLAARLVVKVKYLGMPNVLAKKKVVPEFIQHQARPDAIVKAVWRLMENTGTRAEMITEFGQIVRTLGQQQASKTAAQAILNEIGKWDEAR